MKMPDDAMNTTDSDMMEAETPPPPPAPPSSSGQGGGDDAVRSLLTFARQLIDQGKPSQALQAVVMVMKTRGGDEAVFHALNRARERYITKLQANTGVDELASLFAECAIAEALPSGFVQSHQHMRAGQSIELDARGTSILAESGRTQIVLDAFSDGSSFVCLQCGGLVSNNRRDEHYAYWCCKI